jgi:hypothetical protein
MSNFTQIANATLNLDWFDTAEEYATFFATTLNRWSIRTTIQGNELLCPDEGLTIKIQESEIQCSKPIYEVTMYSNGTHIDLMLLEIMECLRVQKNSNIELTEDEAYALIDVELKNMDESHVQRRHTFEREEIAELVQEHSGVCSNLKRISFGKFSNAVINVSLKDLPQISGATFTNCRFTYLSTLNNVGFVGCEFNNVVFNCKMTDVVFENCTLEDITWPTSCCRTQILNTDDYETEEIEYDDA